MQRDIQPKIEVTEAELRAEYEKLKATEFTKPATVTLQEILVTEDAGGLALARELVARARAGEDFASAGPDPLDGPLRARTAATSASSRRARSTPTSRRWPSPSRSAPSRTRSPSRAATGS